MIVKSIQNLRNFKKVENIIYGLIGHQNELNRFFEFSRVVRDLLKIQVNLPTPNLKELNEAWRTCSEFCHISWMFFSLDPDYVSQSQQELLRIKSLLVVQTDGLIGFPKIENAEYASIQEQFIAGKASECDVKKHFEKTGLWAMFKPNDGSPNQFMGQPLPPNSGS